MGGRPPLPGLGSGGLCLLLAAPHRCRGCREGFHGPRNPPELLDEEALHPTALEEVNPANDYAVNLEVGPSDETTLLTGCSLVTP